MGKHSLPESPGFWRAVIIAGLRYLVVIALLAGVAFGIYKLAFDNSGETPETEDTLSPLPTDPFVEETPTEASPGASPTATAVPQGTGKTQVLDASNSTQRLDAAERKLEEAGYDVVARGNASTPREKTTVFYHPGSQQMGEAVASLIGATLVQPVGDLNLDPAIPVTVIIGPDYAG
ncbi:MAG TPA: LytR C-terminal domain-containing protein [Actinomycetota bacterium]|nr:LytR C-terminal domain-containing protein [Actinomycetota bacterium]